MRVLIYPGVRQQYLQVMGRKQMKHARLSHNSPTSSPHMTSSCVRMKRFALRLTMCTRLTMAKIASCARVTLRSAIDKQSLRHRCCRLTGGVCALTRRNVLRTARRKRRRCVDVSQRQIVGVLQARHSHILSTNCVDCFNACNSIHSAPPKSSNALSLSRTLLTTLNLWRVSARK